MTPEKPWAASAREPIPFAEQCAEDPVAAGTYALSDHLGGPTQLAGFVMDRYPVTVARFAAFIEAGGYADVDLWCDDGWHWRVLQAIEAPRFWEEADPHWRRFLAPDHPVIGVSWYEADAFCRWSRRRLPREAEWEAAARGTDGRAFTWGDTYEAGRIENRGQGPRVTWPVTAHPAAVGPSGHHDLIGNVWQWTTDAYGDGEAVAVRGGSWASRDEHCRTDHRNGYGRDGQWSHVGFRTVAL